MIRGSDNEHADSLPKVDVLALRHVAFVLDALVYYLRKNPVGTRRRSELVDIGNQASVTDDEGAADIDDEDNPKTDDDEVDPIEEEPSCRTTTGVDRFFRRTDSTTVLGCEPPEPLHTPLYESLPLADKPHLLNTNARREQLFGAVQEPTFAEGQHGKLSRSLGLNQNVTPGKKDEARVKLDNKTSNKGMQILCS